MADPARIAAIRERVDAATPGPHYPDFDNRKGGADQVVTLTDAHETDKTICFMASNDPTEGGNTIFFAHAWTDIRHLLEDNKELREANALLSGIFDRICRRGVKLYEILTDDERQSLLKAANMTAAAIPQKEGMDGANLALLKAAEKMGLEVDSRRLSDPPATPQGGDHGK